MKMNRVCSFGCMLGMLMALVFGDVRAYAGDQTPVAAAPMPIPVSPRPNSLPVSSLKMLWAYAFNSHRYGNSQVYGNTILYGSDSYTYDEFRHESEDIPDPAVVAAKIANVQFRFSVSRADRPIGHSAALYDYRGRGLFHSNVPVSIVEVQGTEVMGLLYERKPRLRIADVIYIPYPNARGAMFIERDQFGNVIRYHNIPVVDGEIAWPVGLTSNLREIEDHHGTFIDEASVKKHGEVQVTVSDNNGYRTDAFSLDNRGEFISPSPVIGNGPSAESVSIGGIIPKPDNSPSIRFVVFETQPEFLGRLRLTQRMFVSIYASLGQKFQNGQVVDATMATEGRILDARTMETVDKFTTSNNIPYIADLPAGIYFIELDNWHDPSFGLEYREHHYIPDPNNGGGVGVVAASGNP